MGITDGFPSAALGPLCLEKLWADPEFYLLIKKLLTKVLISSGSQNTSGPGDERLWAVKLVTEKQISAARFDSDRNAAGETTEVSAALFSRFKSSSVKVKSFWGAGLAELDISDWWTTLYFSHKFSLCSSCFNTSAEQHRTHGRPQSRTEKEM